MSTDQSPAVAEPDITSAEPAPTPLRVDARRRAARQAIAYVAVAAVLVVAVLLVRGWRPWSSSAGSDTSASGANGNVAMPVNPQIEAEFGIRFTAVGITSGGGMIMLRYQVLDSDKVLSVHDAKTAPYVIGPDGKKYDAPGMQGHSHIGKKKVAGTTDFILLANSQGRLKPGMDVTVVVGSLRMEHVRIV